MVFLGAIIIALAATISLTNADVSIAIDSTNMPSEQADEAVECFRVAYERYPQSEMMRFINFVELFGGKYSRSTWNIAAYCGTIYTPRSENYIILNVVSTRGDVKLVKIYD